MNVESSDNTDRTRNRSVMPLPDAKIRVEEIKWGGVSGEKSRISNMNPLATNSKEYLSTGSNNNDLMFVIESPGISPIKQREKESGESFVIKNN
jgi:hypothetical protein